MKYIIESDGMSLNFWSSLGVQLEKFSSTWSKLDDESELLEECWKMVASVIIPYQQQYFVPWRCLEPRTHGIPRVARIG